MKGTDEACGTIIARLTCKLLQEWCCADQVVNMAFDNTASNTCIAIQLSLGRPLLWSSGPLSCYIPGDAEPPFLGKLHAELTVCAAGVLDYKRGDYRKFVQLCLVYLGAAGATQTPVTFQRPGALHKAQWMAKLLYTLKLALMEQHITLLPQGTITTRQQVLKIWAFANFITHIYATWWLTCDTAIDAAWNDLTLYHHLYAYKYVDEGIAVSEIKVLEWHLWYLTGKMLPLALFSTKVPVGERRALADAILEHKPADLPMRAPQLRFGTGFGKPKFPALLPTSTTQTAGSACTSCTSIQHFSHSM
ncbi:hypothetical protein SKAU_G00133010 [Synaphobranchus kaupii]|uniref:Uncharacterized protein n=1 Tax=Synaphobranchus kaupii TaxID=118154 RepID=A0A9Q1FRH9_SYNKA|nr:hypothetical protein SKAU_G00133010 [Synaphobranchus kaupii]